MTRHMRAIAIMLFAVALATTTSAQEPPPATGKPPAPPETPPRIESAREITPLRVQIVLSRYLSEKKLSSLPFTLSVNSNDTRGSQLRMGAQVPIVTAMGNPTAPVSSFNYRDVGTSIDCSASGLDSGSFRLVIGIDDSSVYGEEKADVAKTGTPPSFRSFKSNQTVILKDGQSAQYTMATDKVTGEVVRVDVSLTVVK